MCDLPLPRWVYVGSGGLAGALSARLPWLLAMALALGFAAIACLARYALRSERADGR